MMKVYRFLRSDENELRNNDIMEMTIVAIDEERAKEMAAGELWIQSDSKIADDHEKLVKKNTQYLSNGMINYYQIPLAGTDSGIVSVTLYDEGKAKTKEIKTTLLEQLFK